MARGKSARLVSNVPYTGRASEQKLTTRCEMEERPRTTATDVPPTTTAVTAADDACPFAVEKAPCRPLTVGPLTVGPSSERLYSVEPTTTDVSSQSEKNLEPEAAISGDSEVAGNNTHRRPPCHDQRMCVLPAVSLGVVGHIVAVGDSFALFLARRKRVASAPVPRF